jgi:hypothetical protein
MKQLIKRILKESIKEKLERRLEKDGLMETLNELGIDINHLAEMLNTTPIQLYLKYNPFEELFTYQEFDDEVQDSISFLNKEYFLKEMKTKSPEEILDFFISNVIDGLHSKLINFNIEDWIIPDTLKLLKIIYGERITIQPGYKKLVFLAKNI